MLFIFDSSVELATRYQTAELVQSRFLGSTVMNSTRRAKRKQQTKNRTCKGSIRPATCRSNPFPPDSVEAAILFQVGHFSRLRGTQSGVLPGCGPVLCAAQLLPRQLAATLLAFGRKVQGLVGAVRVQEGKTITDNLREARFCLERALPP